MNAFPRGKSGRESIYVPTKHGGRVQRGTGSTDPRVVRDMKRMVRWFADKQRWAIPDALQANRRWTPPGAADTRRLTLADVYAFYAAGQIDQLEAILDAKNLAEHLDAWIAWVRANRRAEVGTADVYWQQVTTLVIPGEVFLATALTKERVKGWLASRAAASSGTRRKYLYALKSFITYLVDAGALAADPLAGMKAPKKNPARERWEHVDVDQAIVRTASDRYRAFFAFIHATGCDVGSAHRAERADLDLATLRANIRGTKTDRRRVHRAEVEPWAKDVLAAHLRTLPFGRNVPLFPDLTNSGASHHHTRCCDELHVTDYTLKDARHSVAVRMRLAGASFEAIAEQLGTSVFQAVTVYSKYRQEDATKVADQA